MIQHSGLAMTQTLTIVCVRMFCVCVCACVSIHVCVNVCLKMLPRASKGGLSFHQDVVVTCVNITLVGQSAGWMTSSCPYRKWNKNLLTKCQSRQSRIRTRMTICQSGTPLCRGHNTSTEYTHTNTHTDLDRVIPLRTSFHKPVLLMSL